MTPETLISKHDIQRRVQELGQQINADTDGVELTLLVVLKGALLFAADLIRALDRPVEIEFARVSSYRTGATPDALETRLFPDPDSLTGREVLIVEDIVDTGHTLSALTDRVALQRPASIRACSLLDKPSRRQLEIQPQYVGFPIEDRFVVGYGLDYRERFRELPYIGRIDPVKLTET